jgi:hypothetical protein
MRTNKKRSSYGSVQLCLFTPAEMKAMEERKVNFKPIIATLWELELLPALKGQSYRDQRTLLLNRSLNERLKVAPGIVSRAGIRRGIRVIDS